jgi:Fe-S cluster assembly iron-binding protein IscA
MIQISDTAQTHFRKLIEREGVPGMGVRLSAIPVRRAPTPGWSSPNRPTCSATSGRWT